MGFKTSGDALLDEKLLHATETNRKLIKGK
jgi:hypothetical protein